MEIGAGFFCCCLSAACLVVERGVSMKAFKVGNAALKPLYF